MCVPKSYVDMANAEADPDEFAPLEVVAGGAAEVGSIFGSQIGSALAGKNVFARVAAGSVLSATLKTIGSGLDTYLDYETGEITLSEAFEAAGNQFGNNLGQAFQSQAIGAVSGFLTGELAEALGLDGFGGGLFRTACAANDNAAVCVMECAA